MTLWTSLPPLPPHATIYAWIYARVLEPYHGLQLQARFAKIFSRVSVQYFRFKNENRLWTQRASEYKGDIFLTKLQK